MSPDAALQLDLLSAAFAGSEDALPAWRRWEAGSNWQAHVDFDSYLLLPRVYHNLGEGCVDDALFGRLKGIIRQNWLTNTRRLVMLRALAAGNSLPPEQLLLLPPLSLIGQDRSSAFGNETPELWLRQPRQLRQLVDDLLWGGWCTPGRRIPRWCIEGFRAGACSLAMEHSDHGALRLRWPTRRGACTETWHPRDTGAQICLDESRWYTLKQEDALRYLLLGPGQGSAFKRCARALLYLQDSQDMSGWQFLLQVLQPGPLLDTVRKLAPPGAGTLVLRSGEPASPGASLVANGRQPFFRKQRQHWAGFRAALGTETGTVAALCALPGYLMGKWQLEKPSQIPHRLLRGLLSDIRYRSRQ